MRERTAHAACAVAAALWLLPVAASAQGPTLDAGGIRSWAALLSVHDRRIADTTAIDSALHSPHAALRAAGARVVGLNRVAARYPALRELVTNSRDTAVARDAAFALGLAADTASCDVLRTATANPSTGVAAAWAIGEMGAQCGAFETLLAGAATTPVRTAVLRVAGKWTPFPDSAVVDAFRSGRSTDERWAALYALSRSRRGAGATLARRAATDSVPRIRELAARLLTVALQEGADSAPALVRLRRLLRDRNAHVRIAAIRSIASFRSAAEEPLLSAWAVEGDLNVKVTLAESIGGVIHAASPVWARWWRADSTYMLRRTLIASAWKADAIDALRAGITEPLEDNPDYRIRVAMIDGPGSARVGQFVRAIAARTSDPDARVRAAAVSALAAASAPSRDSIGWTTLLTAAEADDDVGVRRAALAHRVRTAAAADVPVALTAYARAMRDSSSDVRETALQLVAAAWRRDSAAFADSTLALLHALAPSSDLLIRQRVRSVTPLAHWQHAAIVAPLQPADYERIVRNVILPTLRGRAPSLVIATAYGPIRIMLDGVRTPMTADHLSRLARAGYFRNLRFHRVVPAFVAQAGDPRGDGSGGPGYAIRDELNRSAYVRGAVGMALSGPDTGGSQFFLTLAPQPHLDGHYTVFGRVVAGVAAMDSLVQGDMIRDISTVPE